jgi:hypothetical protein
LIIIRWLTPYQEDKIEEQDKASQRQVLNRWKNRLIIYQTYWFERKGSREEG